MAYILYPPDRPEERSMCSVRDLAPPNAGQPDPFDNPIEIIRYEEDVACFGAGGSFSSAGSVN
jgi:hypothetical protein